VVIVTVLMASEAVTVGDWKSKAVAKALGRAAQDGIAEALEEAFEDAVKDRAFEAATEVEWRGVDETRRWESLESTAGDAVAAAMTAADVAESIDKALDRHVRQIAAVVNK